MKRINNAGLFFLIPTLKNVCVRIPEENEGILEIKGQDKCY